MIENMFSCKDIYMDLICIFSFDRESLNSIKMSDNTRRPIIPSTTLYRADSASGKRMRVAVLRRPRTH